MTERGSRAGCASHIGGRAQQQDDVACFTSKDGRARFLVVADGMGGHRGGELASLAVVETAELLWNSRASAPEDPRAFLEDLCRKAHEAVRLCGRESGLRPLSTIAALIATPKRAWWVHVGDSRVYAFRGDKMACHTEDHTVLSRLVRSGQLDETEQNGHPEQNKLLRGLGGEDEVRASHGQMQMDPATGFVLCTDGFWTVVGKDEMPSLFDDDGVESACVRWSELAAARGGADGDNIAVAVLAPGAFATPFAIRTLSRYWPLYGALAIALAALLARTLS